MFLLGANNQSDDYVGNLTPAYFWSFFFTAQASDTGALFGLYSTAASNVKIAIYDNNQPNNLLSAQEVAVVSGWNYVSLGTTVSIVQGEVYYLCVVAESSSVTYRAGSNAYHQGYVGYAGFDFPATYDLDAGTTSTVTGVVCLLSSTPPERLLVHDGDSHSADLNGYVGQIFDNVMGIADYEILGRHGYRSDQVLADWGDRAGSVDLSTGIPNYYFLLVGTNDLAGTTRTAEDIFGDIRATLLLARDHGYGTIVSFTIMPSTVFNAYAESRRVAINNYLRDLTTELPWLVLVDLANIPLLQDPAVAKIYYDGIHFTPYGAGIVASAATFAAGFSSRLVGDIIDNEPLVSWGYDRLLLSSFYVSVSCHIDHIYIYALNEGNVKVVVYDGTQSSAVNLIYSDLDDHHVFPGWNKFPNDGLSLVADTWVWIGLISDTSGAFVYRDTEFADDYYKLGPAGEDYGTFVPSDPLSGTSNGATALIHCFLSGPKQPPVLTSLSSTPLYVGQTDVVLTGTGFFDNGALLEATSGAAYLNPAELTVTSQTRETLTFNVDNLPAGTLNTIYLHVTDAIGQRSILPLSTPIQGVQSYVLQQWISSATGIPLALIWEAYPTGLGSPHPPTSPYTDYATFYTISTVGESFHGYAEYYLDDTTKRRVWTDEETITVGIRIFGPARHSNASKLNVSRVIAEHRKILAPRVLMSVSGGRELHETRDIRWTSWCDVEAILHVCVDHIEDITLALAERITGTIGDLVVDIDTSIDNG